MCNNFIYFYSEIFWSLLPFWCIIIRAALSYTSVKMGKDIVTYRSIECSLVQSLSHVWLLEPYRLEHARLLCPSRTRGACSNSGPSNQWCHSTISYLVILCRPLLLQPSILPASAYFLSSMGASASASVLPMNSQDWFPLGLTYLISFQSKGISRLLQHHSSNT